MTSPKMHVMTVLTVLQDVFLVDFTYSKRTFPKLHVIFLDLDGGISVSFFCTVPVEATKEMTSMDYDVATLCAGNTSEKK